MALKYLLIIITVAASFFSWQSIDRAINVSGSSIWLAPILWFSLFFISLYLSLVLIKEKHIAIILPLLCFSLSFIFAINQWQLLAIFLGFLLSLMGVYKIRRDLNLNIEISLGKTLNTGKQFIILGMALVISSQYFLTIQNKDLQQIIPKIQSNKKFDVLTSGFLKIVNPDFKNISSDNMTVDEFILQMQKNQTENSAMPVVDDSQIEELFKDQFGEDLSAQEKEKLIRETQENFKNANSQIATINNEVILEEGRKKLSELSGKELTGQEKISEIFSQMINNKITEHFQPKLTEKNSFPLLPLVLAIILFLTIIPLGSFLNIFWVLIARFIFWILIKAKVVNISKVQKEVEIIE